MEISSDPVILDTTATSSTGIPVTAVLQMPQVQSHGGAILLDTTESMDTSATNIVASIHQTMWPHSFLLIFMKIYISIVYTYFC